MSAYKDILNQKAVALSYDEDGNTAPVVVASGMGHMAEKIVETAQNNGIPVYEDNSLATMLTQLELGSPIPEELYQAIVDIYIYFLEWGKKKPGEDEPKGNVMNIKTGPVTSGTGAATVKTGTGKMSNQSVASIESRKVGNDE